MNIFPARASDSPDIVARGSAGVGASGSDKAGAYGFGEAGSPGKRAQELKKALEAVLETFPPISLEEMDSIKLMNRIDSKYVTDRLVLGELLEDALEGGYRVFTQDGVRLHRYDSLYFDTPILRMFTDHRRGKAFRQKVRTREYVESGLCFLEVKRKNNRGRTKKKRIAIPAECFGNFSGDETICSWLAGHSDCDAKSVSPSLETSFSRITLVNKNLNERLTIDLGVSFRNFRNAAAADLGGAVIIELKQDGRQHSDMQDILLRHRVKPLRVSKYCIGIVSTDSSVHPGRFKQKLRTIEKLNKNFYIRCYRPVILRPL